MATSIKEALLMKKIEIVSPAGNLEKLRFAVKYGADNIYFGGSDFNLRVQADNFTNDDLREGVELCRQNGVKTTFLLNSYLHEEDIKNAESYIGMISVMGFDSVMVSDPGMMILLKESGIKADFHLSTQMNVLNHLAVKFWMDAGFNRIVLARETSAEEIKMIKYHTGAEIEVFAHGALCIAYSGRCLLSRYLSGRDANSGDCSQPCRWKYSLMEEKRPGNYLDIIEHTRGTEILSSKDLCLMDRLEEYIDAGVDAFKIEGRMKSLYHCANTTRVYKHAVKLAGTLEFNEKMPFWLEELDLISHRPYTNDLFNEFGELGFHGIPYIKKASFAGYRYDGPDAAEEVKVKTFNPVYKDEIFDGIYPIKEKVIDDKYRVIKITDDAGNEIGMARPGTICTIRFDKPVFADAIFRKRL